MHNEQSSSKLISLILNNPGSCPYQLTTTELHSSGGKVLQFTNRVSHPPYHLSLRRSDYRVDLRHIADDTGDQDADPGARMQEQTVLQRSAWL